LLEKENTPFSPIQASAAPARRLWNYLVRQELVQDTFIRAVFGKKKSFSSILESSNGLNTMNGNDNGGRFSIEKNI